MKSRILSCNMVTAFKKNLTRFAPLWAVYLIGGFLVMMTMTESDSAGGIANSLSSTIGPFSIINLIYACLAAQMLFGDLYNSRLCNALHAMPMRREQWFLSHIAAGLCYSLAPHLIVMPIVMLSMGQFGFVALLWMLGMLLEYLFFFGLAVFCALCVGNRFAMVVVYGMINFASMIVFWFCNAIYVPMMYGVILTGTEGFVQFCPVVQMSSFDELVRMDSYNGLTTGGYNRVWTYEGLGEGWGYLVLCAVLGLALLAAALLLYRRRKLESAGDFIAVKPLAPIFSVVATLCVSAVCAMFGSLFSDGFMVVFLIAGLVVGYFGSQMLLQRTVRVFRLKAFGKLGLIAAAMILSLLLVQWDAFGIVRWTPKVDQVKQASLLYKGLELTEPEDIQLVINLHKEAIAQGEANGPYDGGDYRYVRISYQLKNGMEVERGYEISSNTKAYQALKSVYGRISYVLGDVSDMNHYVRSVATIEINGSKMMNDWEMLTGLMEAIKADCEAGLMAQDYSFHKNQNAAYNIHMELLEADSMYYYRGISVYPDAVNTIAWLKENMDDWAEMSGLDDDWNAKYGY